MYSELDNTGDTRLVAASTTETTPPPCAIKYFEQYTRRCWGIIYRNIILYREVMNIDSVTIHLSDPVNYGFDGPKI